jgi:hypothetical protein
VVNCFNNAFEVMRRWIALTCLVVVTVGGKRKCVCVREREREREVDLCLTFMTENAPLKASP